MLQMVDGKINQIIPQSIWWFTGDGVAAEIVSGVVQPDQCNLVCWIVS